MSSLDQIGQQRSRRGGRRNAQHQQAYRQDPNMFAQFAPPDQTQQQQFIPQQQAPSPQIQQTYQMQPQFASPQIPIVQQVQAPHTFMTQQPLFASPQVIEKLTAVEAQNNELKQELDEHDQKILNLEKQMNIFFKKIDRLAETA